jgi:hypothetical protein
VFAANLNNDGFIDVLSTSIYDNTVAWYKNDGSGNFSATKVISNTALGARSVFAADLNNDGFIDVLSASIYDNTVAWYKNLTP